MLFNNVGMLRLGIAVELSVEDWDFVMNVNVRLVFLGVKFVVLVMTRRGGGLIVNMVLVLGLYGDGGVVVYVVSKVVVINLIWVLLIDYVLVGIWVNVICFGTIEILLV